MILVLTVYWTKKKIIRINWKKQIKRATEMHLRVNISQMVVFLLYNMWGGVHGLDIKFKLSKVNKHTCSTSDVWFVVLVYAYIQFVDLWQHR